jgi:hypothetical protein
MKPKKRDARAARPDASLGSALPLAGVDVRLAYWPDKPEDQALDALIESAMLDRSGDDRWDLGVGLLVDAVASMISGRDARSAAAILYMAADACATK